MSSTPFHPRSEPDEDRPSAPPSTVVKELLFEALERPPEDRAPFLDDACVDRPGLRRELDALVAAHDAADGLMSSPTLGRPARHDRDDRCLRAGHSIGPYRLRRMIGEGGFGTVYLAEQESPVRREVAIKVLKPGMDSRQVVARFQVERQAMAMMDHPWIARVLDAGTTDQGRPFFVMEYVHGTPVTEFAETHRLTVRERLELFGRICLAIQHAHQKGVVHRDLKPTNVLVTTVDGEPAPKVIDFGIAKAVGGKLAEDGATTLATQLVGTPEYMAPEQASMGGSDVDTRADVYSLGILLYELLTGNPPFDRTRIRDASLLELERIILDEEPPRPSLRLASMGTEIDRVAGGRRVEPARLLREIRGDLDWIVMRAIEKDRSRRYPAVNALAQDVQRHLRSESVEAGPPARLYRLGRLWRRHRLAAGAGAVVAVALLLAVIASLSAAAVAHRARDVAVAARLDSDRSAYAASMLAAGLSLRSHDSAGARRHLALAPSSLRGWEWSLLDGYADRSSWTYGPMESKPTHVSVSDDGATVAVGAPDGSLRLLDGATGAERRVVRGHDSAIRQSVFAPDGSRLYTGDDEGVIRVWNPADGSMVGTLGGRSRRVSSPDGSRLSTGDDEGVIQDGNPADGSSVEARDGHSRRVSRLVATPDGALLASGSWDGSVRLWDAVDGSLLRAFEASGSPINNLAISPDGRRLVAGSWDQHLRIWDGRSGELVAAMTVAEPDTPVGRSERWAKARITALDVDPAGEVAVAGTVDGRVTWWRLADGALLASRSLGPRLVRRITVSSDGSMVAACCIDATVHLWDHATREALGTLDEHGRDTRDLCFNASNELLVSASFDRTIRAWAPGEPHLRSTWHGHDSQIYSVMVPPGALRAYSMAEDATVRCWLLAGTALDVVRLHHGIIRGVEFLDARHAVTSDGVEGAVVVDLEGIDPPRGLGRPEAGVVRLAVSPDRATVAIAEMDGGLALWNADDGSLVADVPSATRRVSSMVFTPDGSRLIVGTQAERIHVIDVRDGSETGLVELGSRIARAMDVTPDGTRLLVADKDGTVHVWNLDEGGVEREIVVAEGDHLETLAISPDGRTVAFGGWGRAVRLADIESGRMVGTGRDHASAVFDVAWLPDGSRLLSAGGSTVRIWEPDHMRMVGVLEGHVDSVRRIAVSPDATVVLSGGDDGRLRQWRRSTAPSTHVPASPLVTEQTAAVSSGAE